MGYYSVLPGLYNRDCELTHSGTPLNELVVYWAYLQHILPGELRLPHSPPIYFLSSPF